MEREDITEAERGLFDDCNYSGTLTPTNWKIFYNFINNLPIYKSFQQQVLKLLSHDTINISVRGRNLVKSVNA